MCTARFVFRTPETADLLFEDIEKPVVVNNGNFVDLYDDTTLRGSVNRADMQYYIIEDTDTVDTPQEPVVE